MKDLLLLLWTLIIILCSVFPIVWYSIIWRNTYELHEYTCHLLAHIMWVWNIDEDGVSAKTKWKKG